MILFVHTENDDDSFELEVSSKECVIKAGNRRAFLYAADALLQLCDGSDYTLYEHYVNNPYPEKEIKSIRVR